MRYIGRLPLSEWNHSPRAGAGGRSGEKPLSSWSCPSGWTSETMERTSEQFTAQKLLPLDAPTEIKWIFLNQCFSTCYLLLG